MPEQAEQHVHSEVEVGVGGEFAAFYGGGAEGCTDYPTDPEGAPNR